ncbi:hypothetical protein [Brevundimonas sp.]|uniref:hypothetical protein n=1 Tax=Brevundimonas sp. TaxID=1871086 RepID=UPI00391A1FEC
MTERSEVPPRPLRIYADFNSGGTNDTACWCLRYNGALLDDLERELNLREGQAVVLYYEDPAEEFEVDATLEIHTAFAKWQAMPDWSTMRRLRG